MKKKWKRILLLDDLRKAKSICLRKREEKHTIEDINQKQKMKK